MELLLVVMVVKWPFIKTYVSKNFFIFFVESLSSGTKYLEFHYYIYGPVVIKTKWHYSSINQMHHSIFSNLQGGVAPKCKFRCSSRSTGLGIFNGRFWTCIEALSRRSFQTASYSSCSRPAGSFFTEKNVPAGRELEELNNGRWFEEVKPQYKSETVH